MSFLSNGMLSKYLTQSALQRTSLDSKASTTLPEEISSSSVISAFHEIHDLPECFIAQLNKHIDENSTYTYKTQLLQSLLTIALEIKTGVPNKEAIFNKLQEGIENCSEGLHDRCNEIILSFARPKNLAELLQLSRESLVATTASTLTDEVHAQNTITNLASGRYGVRPRNIDDPYYGGLTENFILQTLENTFAHRFTPFNIPTLICEQIITLLASHYSGKKTTKESGYQYEDYGPICETINQVFFGGNAAQHLPFTDLLLMTTKQDSDEDFVADLNWVKIKHVVFEKMLEEGFLQQDIKNITPENILELAFIDKISPQSINAVLINQMPCNPGFWNHSTLEQALETNPDLFASVLAYAINHNDSANDAFQICVNCIASGVYRKLPDRLKSKVLNPESGGNSNSPIIAALKEVHGSSFYLPDLIGQIKIEELSDTDLADIPKIFSKLTSIKCIEQLINAAQAIGDQSTRDQLIVDMLMAEYPGQGPASAIRIAAYNGHHQCIEQIINAAQAIGDQSTRDQLIVDMLMAEYPGQGPAIAIRIAAYNGHHQCIEQIINAAQAIGDQSTRDQLIVDMLMAEYPGQAPANAIRMAAYNGHHQCIEQIINAAQAIGDQSTRDQLIVDMLMAEYPGQGPANAIRMAAYNGHHQCIEQIINAAQAIGDQSTRDQLIVDMLMAEYPGRGPASAIRAAAYNGHHQCIEQIINAAQAIGDQSTIDQLIVDMLMAEYPGRGPAIAIRIAAYNGHHQCIKQLLKCVNQIQCSDLRQKTLQKLQIARHGEAAQAKHDKIIKSIKTQLSQCRTTDIQGKLLFILSKVYLRQSTPPSPLSRLLSLGRSRDKYQAIAKYIEQFNNGSTHNDQELFNGLNTAISNLNISPGEHLFACLCEISIVTKVPLSYGDKGNIIRFDLPNNVRNAFAAYRNINTTNPVALELDF